jgi:hypothetical protein
VRWDEFAEACPELAIRTQERFSQDEVVMLGTVRKDGWPRVSPVEPDFAAGHLFLGMMWRSRKAHDLRRDSRCVVHSVPTNRMNPGGDIKLYGRAVEVQEPELRRAYRAAIAARIDWAPDEPQYHLYSIDVDTAAHVRFDEGVVETLRWTPAGGLVKEARPSA